MTVANVRRESTQAASVPLVGNLAALVAAMGRLLDVRIGFRFSIVVAGAILATGRRTAANWFRCAGVKDDWDRFYVLLQSIGKNTGSLMMPILRIVVQKFDPGENGQWKFAIDDSPTRRFGSQVAAASIHHNPTPGPGDGPWLYGHNWVCLATLLKHPQFGVLALPLLSFLYIRKRDVPKLEEQYGCEFRTKHELALDLLRQTMQRFRALGSKAGFQVVFDGAYAVRKLIRPLMDEGVTVVSRLRRDAKLFGLPVNRPGQRGRPRIYGKNRFNLAKRAGQTKGWQTIRYERRGAMGEGRYKTFLATSQLVSGVVRVVLLKHPAGNWAAFFSTDSSMSVEAILQSAADRWAIEEHFHDIKEVWGAGEQQVRNLWSNIGCWNLCAWMYTIVELECWDQSSEQLVDRTNRPWDNPARRPSHADRKRHLAREMLREQFLSDLPAAHDKAIIKDRIERLLALAV